jgi:hypothetical protein
VGFYDKGNYEIAQEEHHGTGALLSLRDDLNDTTRISASVQYSRTSFPLSDNNLNVYQNQTAYS